MKAIYSVVVLALIVGLAYIFGRCSGVSAADLQAWKDSANVARAESEEWQRLWALQSAKVDTIRDTVRVRLAAVPRIDSIEVFIHDTVRVREYIERTQPALVACAELELECGRAQYVADSTIAALRRQVAIAQQRPNHSRLRWFLYGVGAGGTGGFALRGVF